MHVTFVVQRYGADVIGGAEHLCRATAHALTARGHRVTVQTTTAREYLHWSEHFPRGRSDDDGVEVHRHAALPADPAAAAAAGARIAMGAGGWDDEFAWARAQGPVSPGLLGALRDDPADRVVVLWTYLYATTQLGAALAGPRAIIVPTAHNEPYLRFGLTRGVMNRVGGFAFLTPEERALVDDAFGLGGRPDAVVGAALPEPLPGTPQRAERRFGLRRPYVLYVGRMDPGKGVGALLAHHAAYRAAGGDANLVFAGPGEPPGRLPAWARHLGRVTDAERADLLAGALALAMPSTNESYSLVMAEAWQQATPTLATAHGAVVAGQTARSGGGLLYLDDATYARQVDRLAGDPALAHALGRAGRTWAAAQTWDAVTDRWDGLLDRMAARLRAA